MAKKNTLNSFLLITIALVFANLFPLIPRYLFNSHLSVFVIIALVSCKPLLLFIKKIITQYISNEKIVSISQFSITVLLNIYTIIFGIILLIGFIITLEFAFQIFTKGLKNGNLTSGPIQNLYIILTGFFSSYFSGLIIQSKIIWPILGISSVLITMLAIIYQTLPFYIATAVILIIFIFYISYQYIDIRYWLQNVIYSLVLITGLVFLGLYLKDYRELTRSQSLNILSARLVNSITRIFPELPLIYEIPEYGFSFLDKSKQQLGATPTLSGIPIFKIENSTGKSPLYLRTLVYDHFTGYDWLIRSNRNFFELLSWNEIEELNNNAPFKELKDEIIDGTYIEAKRPENSVKLQLLLEYFPYLPHTLQTEDIQFEEIKPQLESGDWNTGFQLVKTNQLENKQMYYLVESDKFKDLEKKSTKFFLQLPNNLSAEIKEIANNFKSIKSNNGKINKIIEFLTANYTYNLESLNLGSEKGLLHSFLIETKNGYSVHFATAFIILARLNNIPARYASGFLVHFENPQAKLMKTTVNGFCAHVWPEIWLEKTGWTSIEPTKALIPENFYQENGLWKYKYSIAINSLTNIQLSNIMKKPINIRLKKLEFRLNPYIFLILLLIAGLYLMIRYYSHLLYYYFRKDKKAIILLSRQIVKNANKASVPVPSQTGWLTWQQNLSKIQPSLKEKIKEYVQNIIEVSFNNGKITKQKVKNAYHLYIQTLKIKMKNKI